jgi:hypothetical protein
MKLQLKLVTLESNTKRRLNDVTPNEWDRVYSALANEYEQNRSLLSTNVKTKKVLH